MTDTTCSEGYTEAVGRLGEAVEDRRCVVCGRSFRGQRGTTDRCCSEKCERRAETTIREDAVKSLIEWVTRSCGGDVSRKEWSVVRLLYHEHRPLKAAEIAFMVRLPEMVVESVVRKLESRKVVMWLDLGEGVVKYNLCWPANDRQSIAAER